MSSASLPAAGPRRTIAFRKLTTPVSSFRNSPFAKGKRAAVFSLVGAEAYFTTTRWKVFFPFLMLKSPAW